MATHPSRMPAPGSNRHSRAGGAPPTPPRNPPPELLVDCSGTYIDLRTIAESDDCRAPAHAEYKPIPAEVYAYLEPNPVVVTTGQSAQVDYVLLNTGDTPQTFVIPQLRCNIGSLGMVFEPDDGDAGYGSDSPCGGRGCYSFDIQVTLRPNDDARIRIDLPAEVYKRDTGTCPDPEFLAPGSYRFRVSMSDPPDPADELPEVSGDIHVVARTPSSPDTEH